MVELGFEIEETHWLNPESKVCSLCIRDGNCPILLRTVKGWRKKLPKASALGGYFKRLSCNYFFAYFYLGMQVTDGDIVHCLNEKCFSGISEEILKGLLDEAALSHYNMDIYINDYEPLGICCCRVIVHRM